MGIDIEEPAEESRWDKYLIKQGKKLLKKTSKVFKYIPGVGAAGAAAEDIRGGDLEKKVDRIEAKQTTSLDQLQQLARKALDTKKKVAEMYYFKRQSQPRAEELAHGPEAEQA